MTVICSGFYIRVSLPPTALGGGLPPTVIGGGLPPTSLGGGVHR
jgi:hypothetical protein